MADGLDNIGPMHLPPIVHSRVQTLLLIGPPAFGVTLGGTLVGFVRKLTTEADAPFVPDFVVLLSIEGISAIALAAFLIGATRVRHGAHTYFPGLWRLVPWTAAGGFVFGLIAAGAHALLK